MNETVPPGSGLKEVLDSFGIQVGMLLAGLVGGIVSLQQLNVISGPKAAITLFTSLATACYGGEVVVELLDIQKKQYQFGVAFMLGLLATRIIPVVWSSAPALARWFVTRFTNGGVQPTQGDGGEK